MSEPHDFDWLSRYCKRCGAGEIHAVGPHGSPCAEGSNVVAISHIVRGRRLAEMVEGAKT